MKLWGIILFMLLSAQVLAQNVTGFVFDKVTRSPIPNAVVKKGPYVRLTAYDGYFNLTNLHFGDSVKVSSMGYKTYNYIAGMRNPDTIKIYLEAGTIMLNNVTVNSQRNAKLDSANARQEFAKIFAYKAPTFADAFIKVDPYVYKPDDYITSGHSTADIVGIDLLSIASLFGQQKTHQTRLREIALKEEEINYVDVRFSKQRIISLTHLQGDDLRHFINTYRPDIITLKKMNDYDLIVYIKKCYEEFGKTDQKAR